MKWLWNCLLNIIGFFSHKTIKTNNIEILNNELEHTYRLLEKNAEHLQKFFTFLVVGSGGILIYVNNTFNVLLEKIKTFGNNQIYINDLVQGNLNMMIYSFYILISVLLLYVCFVLKERHILMKNRKELIWKIDELSKNK